MKKLTAIFLILIIFITLSACEKGEIALSNISDIELFTDAESTVDSQPEQTATEGTSSKPSVSSPTEISSKPNVVTSSNNSVSSQLKTESVTEVQSIPTEPYQTNGKATLPLDGFYMYDRGILIRTDYETYIAPERPYKVQNAVGMIKGEAYKLKTFETTLTIKSEDTFHNSELLYPITYYIYNNTAYPYLNKSPVNTPHIDMYPIFGNGEEILVSTVFAPTPIIYNLKTDKYRRLTNELSEYGFQTEVPMSGDGRYVGIVDASNGKRYLYDFKENKLVKIPTPNLNTDKYVDNAKYDELSVWDGVFVGNLFYFKCHFKRTGTCNEYDTQLYCFDIKNNILSKYDNGIDFGNYGNDSWPSVNFNIRGHQNLFRKNDIESGTISVYNIENNRAYTYSLGYPCYIYGTSDRSGRYLLGEKCQTFIAAYDENEKPVYDYTVANERSCLYDLKDGKEIDISSYLRDTKSNRQMYWISNTAVLVVYIKGDLPKAQFSCEILELKDIL